jgi:hypothetical protein
MTYVDLSTVSDFHKVYVEHVKSLDMIEALQQSGKHTVALVKSIPHDKADFRYAPEKWSIKEMLCHMLDTERILCYRALRFARNDKTPLAGFEESDYAPEANAGARNIQQLALEMERLRLTTIDLFTSFTPEMLQRKGVANNMELSVVNLGFIVSGHESHHRRILTERYLS